MTTAGEEVQKALLVVGIAINRLADIQERAYGLRRPVAIHQDPDFPLRTPGQYARPSRPEMVLRDLANDLHASGAHESARTCERLADMFANERQQAS